MDLVELQKEILSPKIKLLGDLLGEVIIEQTDSSKLVLEEEIRKLAKKFREHQDRKAFEQLAEKINNIPFKDLEAIIQAFSLFFQLVNLAEEDYRINSWKYLEKSDDTLLAVVENAFSRGIPLEELVELFGELKIKLVWTAHPTEARRLTNMIKLRKIYDLLIANENPEKIKRYITLIWQSDDIREEKITILDEVRNALFYFENTVIRMLPDLIEELEEIIERVYGKYVKLPKLIEFGSWVGGDRDGHPGVTSSVTIQTLLLHKRLCLRNYLSSIRELLQDLSSSTNIVPVTKELEDSIQKDEKLLPTFASQTLALNKKERYRRKLDLMRIKIENTLVEVDRIAEDVGLGKTLVGFRNSDSNSKETWYHRSNEFLEDLQIIERSLKQNKGNLIAKGELSRLITKVELFGFHLAPLDLRQHSKVHEKAIHEIFDRIGREEIKSLGRKEKLIILQQEIINPRPLGISTYFESYSKETQELISTLEVARDALHRISPRTVESYIISMTQDEVDILSVLLLMKETGLIKLRNDTVIQAFIDIVPLFETREDLSNAPEVLRNLFLNPVYRSYLEARNNIQEIMIGYSDSGKDAGILQSNYSLFTAQIEFLKVAKEFGITLRIFHGRGGSVSRGGGPTHKAILGLPFSPRIKITEQGEVIGWNYSNPTIARRHMEQVLSALIKKGISEKFDLNPEINNNFLETFKRIATESSRIYELTVKKDPQFIKFYLDFTPIDAVERATIGSRPSRRSSGDAKSIDQLRAIPWVFSWMQTRVMFPAFFGTGSALTKEIKNGNLEQLQEMYKSWPYFKSLIDNMQMVMAKADFTIAEKYLRLIDSNNNYFAMIKKEFKSATNAILSITGNQEPLSHAPDILNSIKRRNVYIDPLHLAQIRVLKLWRQKGRPENIDSKGLLRLLLLTQNGIAAGMRNTG